MIFSVQRGTTTFHLRVSGSDSEVTVCPNDPQSPRDWSAGSSVRLTGSVCGVWAGLCKLAQRLQPAFRP